MKKNLFSLEHIKKMMHKKPGSGKRVFVGVSGGVDSSVAAALLRDEGYDVVGVFIRTWTPEWLPCTWREERRDAMRVCAHLGIPFKELNLEKEYKQGVADDMIAEYRAGRTPNPDVLCNKEIKFGGFLTWALNHGADFVATGHYAQVQGTSLTKRDDNKDFGTTQGYHLIKGIDQSKDQSYFLWTLTPDQLQHVLFPIGHLPKSEVRKYAASYQLPTAVKKDSQGICFIGMVDMKEFLKHYIDIQPGKVVDHTGKEIGHHEGVVFYTLGERHGFTITDKGTFDLPYYVIEKDIKNNILVVAQHHEQDQVPLFTTYALRDVLLRDAVPQNLSAQMRYHGEYFPCSLFKQDDVWYVTFEKGRNDIALGQSVVFYQDEVCLGGGMVTARITL
jgi:tRNA-specific 2-thiouridylase